MAKIKPFRALRPDTQWAEQIASPPYDVLNSREAGEMVKDNPNSFLKVTKSEVSLPGITDTHAAEVYVKAKENLDEMRKDGLLLRDEMACYYIYELTMNGRSQTGLVATSAVDDYENDIIKKHEYTRPEKELDRINHIKVSGAQTGNVFLAYHDVNEINLLVKQWQEQHPAQYDFTSADNIRHRVWVINDANIITNITNLFEEKVPATYIADGHHRAASAAKVRQSLDNSQKGGADYFLTTLFPASELRIMDYNRLVKDINGYSEPEFLQLLQDVFVVEKSPVAVAPGNLHEFGMYLGGNWYKLTARPGTYLSDPIGILDVSILQNNVLDRLLNIKDQRTDTRIDFVGGIRGLRELEKRVDSGEMMIAFSLYPVSIQQLFNIADSGNVMPPKSTWFEPKLRDGLLTHLIYE